MLDLNQITEWHTVGPIDYDEDGYQVTVPVTKPQPIIPPDMDHVPDENVIYDGDGRPFRYPL